jgi:hypothetical protein
MNFSCKIIQDGGLGDIIFLQSLIKSLKYTTVYWPMSDHFLKTCTAYMPSPKIKYVKKEFSITEDCDILNFDKAHLVKPSSTRSFMYPKYEILNQDPKNWGKFCTFNRNNEKEVNLKNILNPPDGYKLVNLLYGSYPNSKKREDLYELFKNDSKVVFVEPIKGFDLFDWSLLIEEAEEIHTVETSMVYLVELLKTTEKLYMYRKGTKEEFFSFFNNWDYINLLHQKKWSYENL